MSKFYVSAEFETQTEFDAFIARLNQTQLQVYAHVPAKAEHAVEPDQNIGTRPEATHQGIVEFLRSDPLYTTRTFAAIAKHFTGNVHSVLDDLIDNDDVVVLHRRSDGVALYRAA